MPVRTYPVVEKELLRAFGEAVRLNRRRRGLSQQELAASAGLQRTYLADIERGARNVSFTNITRIAEALRLPLHKLFRAVEQRWMTHP